MATITHRRIGASAGFDPSGAGGRPENTRNLYRDYAVPGDPAWRTVPGFRLHASFTGRINGIFPFEDGILQSGERVGRRWLVHAGTELWLVRADDGTKRRFYAATLADRESRCCRFDGWFYLVDGTNFIRVRELTQGASTPVLVAENVVGYVPTCLLNGEPYEAANLLSDVYRIAADLSDSGSVCESGFRFARASRSGEAVLISASDAVGDVYLPETVKIDGVTLRLTEIGRHAFDGNLTVTSVVCPDGLTRVGASAFRDCTALAAFSGGEELTRIGLNAFRGCTALSTLILPGTLKLVQSYAFYGCSSLTTLHYGGADFESEVGVSILGNGPLSSLAPINGSDGAGEFGDSFTMMLDAPAYAVSGVTLDGAALSSETGDPRYSVGIDDGKAVSVKVTTSDRRKLRGGRLTVTVVSPFYRPGAESVRQAFPGYGGDISAMIRGCRLIAAFDGRLFLSGNPALPDAVFYSARSSAGTMEGGYFGVYQYFRDGEASDRIVSLVAGPDALTVFTTGVGRGGVYRHTVDATGDDQLPRIYPRESESASLGEVGEAILYRDEPIFITSSGAYGVSPIGLRYERSAVCRSEAIASLFPADPTPVRLTVWEGYLAVVLPDGEILLGDGRQKTSQPSGATGFEWWRLSGIGGHSDDRRVYRFSSTLPSGAAALGITLAPPDLRDTEAEGTVLSESGTFSVVVGGRRFAVYGGRERTGGTLLPPTAVAARGDELFFGTAAGKLYRFNTDKRGLPPTVEISGMSDSVLARYRESHPGVIAPEWYDFEGHAISAVLESASDDGGLPTSRKNTVAGSSFLDVDLLSHSTFRLTVGSDGKTPEQSFAVNASGADFSTLDFGAFSFSPCGEGTVVFREKCRLWHRKRYRIEASDFRSPIALRAILYRAEDAGKVKEP